MHSFLAQDLEKLKEEVWQELKELWAQRLLHTNQKILQVKQNTWPSAALRALNSPLSTMPAASLSRVVLEKTRIFVFACKLA